VVPTFACHWSHACNCTLPFAPFTFGCRQCLAFLATLPLPPSRQAGRAARAKAGRRAGEEGYTPSTQAIRRGPTVVGRAASPLALSSGRLWTLHPTHYLPLLTYTCAGRCFLPSCWTFNDGVPSGPGFAWPFSDMPGRDTMAQHGHHSSCTSGAISTRAPPPLPALLHMYCFPFHLHSPWTHLLHLLHLRTPCRAPPHLLMPCRQQPPSTYLLAHYYMGHDLPCSNSHWHHCHLCPCHTLPSPTYRQLLQNLAVVSCHAAHLKLYSTSALYLCAHRALHAHCRAHCAARAVLPHAPAPLLNATPRYRLLRWLHALPTAAPRDTAVVRCGCLTTSNGLRAGTPAWRLS